MRLKGLVVLVVVLVAMLSGVAKAAPVGGTVSAVSAGKVVGPVNGFPFSVSFGGTDYQEVSNAFLIPTKSSGQLITVLKWGGKYQIRLEGREEPNAVYGGVAALLGKNTRVRADLRDWVVWRLTAQVVPSQNPNQVLEPIEVWKEGPRTGLNVSTSIPRASAYAGGTNNWLQRSLRQDAAGEMAQKVFDRLLEMERLEAANRHQNTGGDGAEPLDEHQYLMLVGNRQVRVTLRALDYDSAIGVYRNGRQVGLLKADYFDAARTRVRVSGDIEAALEKGVSFKTL
jgi:hypothetical protein